MNALPAKIRAIGDRLNRGAGTLTARPQQTIAGVRPTRKRNSVISKAAKHPVLAITALNTALVAGYAAATIGTSQPTQSNLTPLAANQPTTSQQRFLPNVAAAQSVVDTVSLSREQTVLRSLWVPPWNLDASRTQVDGATTVSAFWLTVSDDASSVTTKGDWTAWQSFAKELPAGTPRYVTVTGSPDVTSRLLVSVDLQSAFVSTLIKVAQEQNFTGVDLNFEGLGIQNRDLFTSFTRNLARATKDAGLKLSVTLEARLRNEVPMDWRAIGILADEVRVMAYDYRSRQTNEPGPVAPLGWVAEVAGYAAATIPSEKLVFGLGNYGYDWSEPQSTLDSWEGVGLSYERAMSLATEEGSPITRKTGIDSRGYDIGIIPSFSYIDSQEVRHEVWFEDSGSLADKIASVRAAGINQVIFWSVGIGDPKVWQP